MKLCLNADRDANPGRHMGRRHLHHCHAFVAVHASNAPCAQATGFL